MYFSKLTSALGVLSLAWFLAIANAARAEEAAVRSNSAEEQARALISQMTLEEKIGMAVGDGRFVPGLDPENDDAGKGMIVQDQRSKLVIPRLSIRTTAMSDGPAGLNREPRKEGDEDYQYTTAFPTATCLAATWNTDIAQSVGEAFGEEVLEYDYQLILAPGLNIHRNPMDGRSFEYYSEDPLLSGKLAAAVVNGLQSNGIATTLKHFAVHNQQSNRRTNNAVVSQRALREIYLRGFEIAVKESHPKAIMSTYNMVNGHYTAENPELLLDIVRDEWGFEGLHITDFDGYGNAVAKVRGGTNLLMSGNEQEVSELKDALKAKTLDESTLDDSLVYCLKLKLDSPRAKGHVPTSDPDLEAHAAVALQAAEEGVVLLENKDSALPLTEEKTLAVFGKTAYDLIPYGTGSGMVRSTQYRTSINDGLQAVGFTTLDDMEAAYVAYIEKIKRENLVPEYFDNPKMRKDNGIVDDQAPPHFKERLVAFSKEAALPREQIEDYAARTDAAIITFGRSAGENYENGYLPMSPIERDLLRDVCGVFHGAGKKVIVVLNVGGVWEIASWRDQPDAILLAWMPGQEGGTAIANIINGTVNPSGKLPDSIPVKYKDVPSAGDFPGVPADDPVNSYYTEGIYVGYRYYESFDVPTAYPFGYGMSYTTFDYTGLEIGSDTFDSSLDVSVTVTNTGEVPGKETVQLYLAAPTEVIEKPVQELKGFAKTKLLQPGESQQLHFQLDARALASFWSGKSAWIADKGNYEVRIAAASDDIRLRKSFTVNEDIVVEEVHDVLFPNFDLDELRRNK